MTEDQSRLGSVRANRGIDRRKFMKSLGAIGISGAGLNTAIGKLEPLLLGDRVRIVTHRSKGEPVRTKQVPKNGLNRKSEQTSRTAVTLQPPRRVIRSPGSRLRSEQRSCRQLSIFSKSEFMSTVLRELMRTFQRRSMECQLPLHAGKNTNTYLQRKLRSGSRRR